MLEALTNEQLIKLEAPRYVGEVSPDDLNQELREMAQGTSETISESEFKEWYRQQLNETGLTDSEYKEIVTTRLLTTRLNNYLYERMPTVVEQVHLHAILLKSYEDAEKIRARWEAGEDFADLAREVSFDEQVKEKGGDLGWVPHGVIDLVDYVAFDLEINEVSQPVPYTDASSQTGETYYYLFMVPEKTDAREVDEEYLPALKGKALQDWLVEEIQLHKIKCNFNSEIYAWINWQLAKSESD